ncbi:MAG: hypothetical protein ACYDEN_06170 [Acidimicrobiales bacterium]
MATRTDCRHYLARTSPRGETAERCRLGMATEIPFACPDECLFFEARASMGAGWATAPSTPMSNTADRLVGLPPPKRRRGKGKRN